MNKFELFKKQWHLLREELEKYHEVWIPPLRGKPTEDDRSNWFYCFVPKSWGSWTEAVYGVHFDFIYAPETRIRPECLRLPIGVETPLKEERRQSFKEEVISRVRWKGIDQSGFRLKAADRKKLLEVDPIPFDQDSWRIALDKYIALGPVVEAVAEVIREYSDKGAFNVPLKFPR